MWLGVRRPLADGMRVQARRVRSAAEPMRRSWYMLGLAWKPAAAKEVRMFGLGDWIADRHREEWLEGIRPAWDGVRRLTRTAWITGGVVLVAYTLVAGWLGWTAYHHEISLRTLATMLPMLPASMAAGSISLRGHQPRAAALGAAGPRLAHQPPGSGWRADRRRQRRPPVCHARSSRSSRSSFTYPNAGRAGAHANSSSSCASASRSAWSA